ncbi:integrase core domain-containing protein [Mesotoga infera]|uniref:integrase core domain-containing protein n=1 Tax=Mesotoga infera TaxID=1236046 RepID=UPI00146E8E0E
MIRIRHEFIEKGKPQQNGFSESFNARFEDECLRMLDLNLIRASLMKRRSDSVFSVTDSQVMIHSESSLLKSSLFNTFSLYLSHFWGHIRYLSVLSQQMVHRVLFQDC